MNDVQLILTGFALGAVPTTETGRIMLAAVAKKAGVKPRQVAQYQQAAEGTTDGGDQA